MLRRPPRSTPLYSSAASDVYKRQLGKKFFLDGDADFVGDGLDGVDGLGKIRCELDNCGNYLFGSHVNHRKGFNVDYLYVVLIGDFRTGVQLNAVENMVLLKDTD